MTSPYKKFFTKGENFLIIISIDSVGDNEYEMLTKYPAFKKLINQSSVYRRVPSVFVTNTYPVHASVATGVTPDIHGLVSNTEPFPSRRQNWNCDEKLIRAKTIWQAAAEKKIETAAIFWPVTANSKTIKYNIPEIYPQPGENAAINNLRAGSKLLQIEMLLRFGRMLDGANQPALDYFKAACAARIIKKYNPGLVLLHLTAYDTIRHEQGAKGADIETALESLDNNLKTVLDAAGDERDVIIFSDHGQIDVHTAIDPNEILLPDGLIYFENDGYRMSGYGCFFECCGGSAFFHAGSLPAEKTEEAARRIQNGEGFKRFLTEDEKNISGYKKTAFGFCAEAGYYYEAFPEKKAANHGYPLDTPGYEVFYIVKAKGFKAGEVNEGGSLLEIAGTAAGLLGLDGFKNKY